MIRVTEGGHCPHQLGLIIHRGGKMEQDAYCCRCGEERFARATYLDPAEHGPHLRRYDREVVYETPWTEQCSAERS